MLRGQYLWLTVLYFTIDLKAILASDDDREHVHIKVHMPEVVRKHTHYHKVKKYQHHQPHPHIVQHQQQPLDVDLLYAHQNVGPQFFPSPLATLPEPELIDDNDEDDDETNRDSNHYAADLMSAMFEGDALTFPQPYRPAVPPPPPPLLSPASTHTAPYSRQQLMQQLFSPEIMSVLAGGGAFGGGGDTNSLLADDFLAELKRDYAKKLHQQHQFHPDKVMLGKTHKKKKYASDSYQKQLQQYGNSFPSNNNNYDMRPNLHNFQQQQLQQAFSDNLRDMMEEFDDKNSDEEVDGDGNGGGGESFQDMYASYTQSADLRQPATTTPTRLKWRPFQPQSEPFMLPSAVQFGATQFSFPLTSGSTAGTATQSTRVINPYESRYKKRKNRIKSKRTRTAKAEHDSSSSSSSSSTEETS